MGTLVHIDIKRLKKNMFILQGESRHMTCLSFVRHIFFRGICSQRRREVHDDFPENFVNYRYMASIVLLISHV